MKQTAIMQGVPGQCPYCHHPPIRHVPDGTGYTCLVCAYTLEQAVLEAARTGSFAHAVPRVCTVGFQFKLPQREREQAATADKNSFAPKTVCAVCTCHWEAHQGYLCPTGDSTFVLLLDKDLAYIQVN
jgi:hypothetical protein